MLATKCINLFMGPIPNLSKCINLFNLQLRDNQFIGLVLDSIMSLPSLKNISLANNELQGPFPAFSSSVTTFNDDGIFAQVGKAKLEENERKCHVRLHFCGEEWSEVEYRCHGGSRIGAGEPSECYRFYLASAGVDGVKVDVQCILETLSSRLGGRVELTRQYHLKLESSKISKHPPCISSQYTKQFCRSVSELTHPILHVLRLTPEVPIIFCQTRHQLRCTLNNKLMLASFL